MRSFLSAIAQDLSFNTDQACDGEDALMCLHENEPFDVALLDWNMPKMDGIALLNEVRSHPEFDSMKIVMVTSNTAMQSICEAPAKGADDYLMKPISPDMLAEKLQGMGILD
jgi:two-component system chemotaxis response regulator CheY